MALPKTSIPRPGYRIALLATCLAAVVVMLGAFTRLTDAGLGCPDWPGCYGHLMWPTEVEEVARADALYPDMPVDTDKTWPEMVHRYFASTLGLFIVALSVIAWRHREARNYPFRLPNYWAEWCRPCRIEIPELNHFAQQYPDNVRVLSVNFDGVVGESLSKQVQALGIEFDTLLQDPRVDLAVPASNGLPETIVLNRKGEVQQVLFGPQTLQSLEAILDAPRL